MSVFRLSPRRAQTRRKEMRKINMAGKVLDAEEEGEE
jgi:hypothetical protein